MCVRVCVCAPFYRSSPYSAAILSMYEYNNMDMKCAFNRSAIWWCSLWNIAQNRVLKCQSIDYCSESISGSPESHIKTNEQTKEKEKYLFVEY